MDAHPEKFLVGHVHIWFHPVIESCVDEARNNETVVAIVDGGETTLKRFQRSRSKVTLTPANDTMEPMTFPVESVDIRGVLVGVVRAFVR